MFENPRRDTQARNFGKNVPKIVDLKSSSEQIFSENCRWVPLICLRVLRESNKSWFDSYSVRNSVLIISHITFRDCRVHMFSDNLSLNSCIWNDAMTYLSDHQTITSQCPIPNSQNNLFWISYILHWIILQSNQVKRTPQDSINELIISEMNPLVVPVTGVKFKAAFLHG